MRQQTGSICWKILLPRRTTYLEISRLFSDLSDAAISGGVVGLSTRPFQYVRREIRQLTDSDREAFFDAMETLYRLPTPEGNALYGEEYKVK